MVVEDDFVEYFNLELILIDYKITITRVRRL